MNARHIRILISSPGDVAEEREKAKKVAEILQKRFAGRLILQAILWEDLPLPATASFQEGIDLVLDDEKGIDIAIFILWSRLGTPLGPKILNPDDGHEYLSGTEREFDLMIRAYEQSGKQRPEVFAYLREDENEFQNKFYGKTDGEVRQMIDQRGLLKDFIAERFHDPERGHNLSAYKTFPKPTVFAEKLKSDLKQVLDNLAQNTSIKTWEGSPFRGLEVFEEQHEKIYFGRDEAIRDLRLKLHDADDHGCAFVLVVGGSGTGKSSLVRAGLIPSMLSMNIDTESDWRSAVFIPSQCSGGLCAGLLSLLNSSAVLPELKLSKKQFELLSQTIESDPKSVIEREIDSAFGEAKQKHGKNVRVLLVIDQLEELFSHAEISDENRDRLLKAIQALARSGHFWIVATIRSDYYHHVLEEPSLVELKNLGGGTIGQFELLLPTAAELRSIISKPAEMAGLKFEEDQRTGKKLDEIILEASTSTPEAMPMLEFLLQQLYERRSDGDVLGIQAYEKLGGLEGAIGSHAESIYQRLPKESQQALPRVLSQLVSLSGKDKNTLVRRNAEKNQFTNDQHALDLIEKLTAERLIVADSGQLKIVHEALLRNWGRVIDWADENRDFVQIQDRVIRAEKEWRSENKSTDYLLAAGKPTADGEALLNKKEFSVTQAVREYVELSSQFHEKRSKRKLRIFQWASMAFMILTILAIYGLIDAHRQEGIARTQTSIADRKTEEADKQKNISVAAAAKAKAAEAEMKIQLRVAENNLGKVFAEKAQRAANAKRHNSAHLYALLALSKLDQQSELATVNSLVELAMYGPIYAHAIPQIRHEDNVTDLVFSPDSRKLFSANWDHNIHIVNLANGRTEGTLRGHSGTANALDVSPDGAKLVSGADDKTVRIWELSTQSEALVLSGHEAAVSCVAFSPDGTWVASGAVEGPVLTGAKIRIWDASNGEQVKVLDGHKGTVSSLAFSPDGKTLISGSWDQTVRVWDLDLGKQKVELSIDSGEISSVAFSPRGDTFAAGTQSIFSLPDPVSRIHVWDAETLQMMNTLAGGTEDVNDLAFSSQGGALLAGYGNGVNGSDNVARLWNIKSGELLAVLEGHSSSVACVAFSPDGSTIATGSTDNTTQVWDQTSNRSQLIWSIQTRCTDDIEFSPNGRWLVASSESLNSFQEIDSALGRLHREFEGHTDNVTSVAYSPDGESIASGSYDKTVRFWDSSTGQEERVIDGHTGTINSVCFSPDGQTVASASQDYYDLMKDATIRIWDVKSGRELSVLSGHVSRVNSIDFSSDGSRIVSGGGTHLSNPKDNTIRIWDMKGQTNPLVITRHSNDVTKVMFSPKGDKIVSCSWDKTVRMFDAESGLELAVADAENSSIEDVTFSPNGETIFVASGKTVKVLDAETLQLRAAFEGESFSRVNSIAISSDGSTLAAASNDDRIRLWRRNHILDRVPTTAQVMNKVANLGMTLEDVELVPLDQDEPSLDNQTSSPRWPASHPLHWIQQAESGDLLAMVELGLCYEKIGHPRLAELWYKKAADSEDQYGRMRLSLLIESLQGN